MNGCGAIVPLTFTIGGPVGALLSATAAGISNLLAAALVAAWAVVALGFAALMVALRGNAGGGQCGFYAPIPGYGYAPRQLGAARLPLERPAQAPALEAYRPSTTAEVVRVHSAGVPR